MTERKPRIGDVYLEPDGWGRLLTAAAISDGDNRIVTWHNLKQTSLWNAHVYCKLGELKVPKDWVFLFNLGELFHDATKKE